jgi:hypothetical protein
VTPNPYAPPKAARGQAASSRHTSAIPRAQTRLVKGADSRDSGALCLHSGNDHIGGRVEERGITPRTELNGFN